MLAFTTNETPSSLQRVIQILQRRQLPHSTRNRASQLIAIQFPALSTNNTTLEFNANTTKYTSRALTDTAATSTPCYSESRQSVDCRTSSCKINEATRPTSGEIKCKQTKQKKCFRFYSQFRERRQLPHGARNCASQLITVQDPTKIDERTRRWR